MTSPQLSWQAWYMSLDGVDQAWTDQLVADFVLAGMDTWEAKYAAQVHYRETAQRVRVLVPVLRRAAKAQAHGMCRAGLLDVADKCESEPTRESALAAAVQAGAVYAGFMGLGEREAYEASVAAYMVAVATS